MTEADEEPVSVVVCTRDRGQLVVGAVRSLLASTGVYLDVIVIDQSSTDTTAEALAARTSDVRLSYVRSEGRGLCHSRNLGLRMARSEIVLYTDDDVTVSPDWARIMAAEIASDDRIAVSFSRVEPAAHDRSEGFIPHHLAEHPAVVKSLWSKSRIRGIGAGMGVRRRAVLAMGGFDEYLGPGAPLPSADDRDIAARALVSGWWVSQTPDAIAVHHGFRSWDEGKELTRRDWQGIGGAYAKYLRTGNWRILPVLAHEVFYFGLMQPLALRLSGRRRSGLRRLGYFATGCWIGLRTPLDHDTLLYRPCQKERVVAP